MTLDKVFTADLNKGMYVSELDRPWLGTPFLFQGFTISSDNELSQLRETCEFVYIDTSKSEVLPTSQLRRVSTPPAAKSQYKIRKTVEQEITTAYREYHACLQSLERLLGDVQRSQAIASDPIKHHIQQCTQSIIRNPSALTWLSRIKHADNYTAEHSLNVGILAISLGRHLGYEREDLETLGLCGILHDVGKMLIDPNVLNKAEKLTEDEFAQIRMHPVFGQRVLQKDSSLNNSVIEAALSHHERIDGRGYPHSRGAAELHRFTRIITIVDAFDAITSERCYSTAKSASEALKILYENRNQQFDDELVIKFIECIGVYPPGSLVEMDSGEVGFVLNTTNHRLYPRVALLLDQNKRPMLQHIVDLSKQLNTAGNVGMRIKAILPDGSYDLRLEDYTQSNIRIQGHSAA